MYRIFHYLILQSKTGKQAAGLAACVQERAVASTHRHVGVFSKLRGMKWENVEMW